MWFIRKGAKVCSESRIIPCLVAGWAEKGQVVMLIDSLNVGTQSLETGVCSELSCKGHGQHIQGPCCLPPWDAAELSCGVLCSPLTSFAFSPVLERAGETGEGSASMARNLQHMF